VLIQYSQVWLVVYKRISSDANIVADRLLTIRASSKFVPHCTKCILRAILSFHSGLSPKSIFLATSNFWFCYISSRFQEWQFFVLPYFCSIFNAFFLVVKLHFGMKFWVWVSFYKTILKFHENRRRQVNPLTPQRSVQ